MHKIWIGRKQSAQRQRIGEAVFTFIGTHHNISHGNPHFTLATRDLNDVNNGSASHFSFEIHAIKSARPNGGKAAPIRVIDAVRVAGSKGHGDTLTATTAKRSAK